MNVGRTTGAQKGMQWNSEFGYLTYKYMNKFKCVVFFFILSYETDIKYIHIYIKYAQLKDLLN